MSYTKVTQSEPLFSPMAPQMVSGATNQMPLYDFRLRKDRTLGSMFTIPPLEVMYRSWIVEFISSFIFSFLVYLTTVYSLAVFFAFPSSIFGSVLLAAVAGSARAVCICIFGPEKAGFLNPSMVITEMFNMDLNWILGGVMILFIQPAAFIIAAGLAFALIPDPLAAISNLGTPTPNPVILSLLSDAQVFFLVTLLTFVEISITTWSLYANMLPKIRQSAEMAPTTYSETGLIETNIQLKKNRNFPGIGEIPTPIAPDEKSVIYSEYGSAVYSEKRKGFFITGITSGATTFIVSLCLTSITGGTTNLYLWLWIAIVSGTVSSSSGIVAGSLAANVLLAPLLAFLIRKMWEYAASGQYTYANQLSENSKRD